MTLSWKAFFFGAIDSAAFITVDKPPLAFWLQALLARAIGFSSWSILLPQAAATLASVLVVYRLARHQFGGVAGIVSGLVFALTPITVAIARDNIPDAVLIALMVGGAWATFDAIRTGRLGSLLMAGALVGLAFNTKMLQAYLVVPTLAATYLIAASGSLLRRVRNLAAAGVVLAIVSASWLTVVDAIPANARPFVGGSADDTVLNLVLGYNGVERILGREAPEIITEAYGRGVGFGGAPGPTRLFSAPLDGQISWLLPLAAGSLIAGLVSRGRRGRTDLRRAWFVLWGGWLAVHAVVLSFARGGFHPYYTATMAPAIAALVGPGSIALWRLYRRSRAMAWLLPVSIGGTAAWAAFLIARADWLPWLAPAVVVAGGAAVAGLLVGRVRPSGHGRRVARGAALLGLIAVLAGPVAWSAAAVTSRVNGNNPLAGPASAQVFAGLGGGPQLMGGARARGTNGFWPMGGAGGRVSDALIGYLRENRGSSTWLVAVPSANRAAPIILETGGEPVMAIGGFSGRDPAPTLAQLGELVATGALRYVLLEDGGPGRGNSEIAAWVQGNGTLVDAAAYGGQGDGELYDLRPSPA
jgi:4-amino-4-deoxy-L-arabinose transferase-like glycosyltransferase